MRHAADQLYFIALALINQLLGWLPFVLRPRLCRFGIDRSATLQGVRRMPCPLDGIGMQVGDVVSSPRTSGHRLESTAQYLGIEVDDALEIAEQSEI